MLTAIIFDFDMTLVDSLEACAVGANLLADRYGLPRKTEAEVLKALSLPTKAFWACLWGKFEPEWAQYFVAEVVPQVAHLTRLFPDTEEILAAAKRRGHLLGIATNRSNPWHDLAGLGLAKWFDTAVGASDVPRPKPEPDMILTALRQLGVEASKAIYVGDSPSDMACAKGAGVKALGLLQGGATAQELSESGASVVRASLGESRDTLNL
jgi:HAD superfamily hydrolase (TIGR01509 family)